MWIPRMLPLSTTKNYELRGGKKKIDTNFRAKFRHKNERFSKTSLILLVNICIRSIQSNFHSDWLNIAICSPENVNMFLFWGRQKFPKKWIFRIVPSLPIWLYVLSLLVHTCVLLSH